MRNKRSFTDKVGTDGVPKKAKPRVNGYVIAAIILAAASLFLALRDISWIEVFQTIQQGKIELVLLVLLSGSIGIAVRSTRWRVLINYQKSVSPLTMFLVTSIGYFGNNFLPARAGEIIRSVVLARKEKMDFTYVLVTALIERVIDAAILIIIGVILIPKLTSTPEWMTNGLRGMALVGFLAILVVILLPFLKQIILRLLAIMPIPRQWSLTLEKLLGQIILGTQAFTNPKRGVLFLAFSAMIWSIDGFNGILIAKALNLTLTFWQVMLLIVAIGLSSAIPSTPGYVGVYQFVAVSLLPLFGVSKSQALAYILVYQAIIILIVGVLGLLSIWILGLRRVDLTTSANENTTRVEELK